MIDPQNLIQALEWRYATKAFDPSKRIPTPIWDTLLKSLPLAPSSYGLQPWKILVIETPEIREKILPIAYQQRQVVDASHLIVITALRQVEDQDLTRLSTRMDELRPEDTRNAKYLELLRRTFLNESAQAKADQWASNQAYILLGQLLLSCALLGLDACPMEGFQPQQLDVLLGLENNRYRSVLVCPVGYRLVEDAHAQLPKVRYLQNEMIEIR